MGGAAVVVDAEAACGTGGVEGTTWGSAEVVGAAQGAAEVGEACDEIAVQALAVRPPRAAV
jgi:hypothetical protein